MNKGTQNLTKVEKNFKRTNSNLPRGRKWERRSREEKRRRKAKAKLTQDRAAWKIRGERCR